MTGIGPWFWSCDGLNGGSPASCSAAQSGGIVHKSSDSGANWTPGKTGLGFNNPTNATLVSPSYASDRTIFVGANGGIYKSSDSGDTWAQTNTAYSVQALVASPAYSSDRTIFAGAYTTGIYKSTDAGATWAQSNTGLGNTTIFSLAISPTYSTDHIIFAGLYTNGVYKSTDSGVTWSAANAGISTLSALSLAVSPAYATDRTVFAATTDGIYSGGGPYYHVYKSTDGGSTWALADSGLSGSISSLAISPAFASDQTLFAASSSGIYKTHDSGNSWTLVKSASSVNTLTLSPSYASDQTVLFAAYGDNVYRSSNGGSSWSPSNSAFDVGRKQLKTLALSPTFASDHIAFASTYLAGPYISVSPGTIPFGNIKANTTSSNRQLTITNGNGMFGDANLAISAFALSGTNATQFSISPGNCGSLTPVLVPGASCSVDITLTPDSAGSKTATLQVAHNNLQQPFQSVTLSGTGVSVSSTIIFPATGFFTNGTSLPVSGTTTCTGGCTIALVEVSADGGATWQAASGTTLWSSSIPVAMAGNYTIRSRATSGSIIETPGTGVTVTVDRTPPSGTLALYYGNWTLDAMDPGVYCFNYSYPSICGTLEMSLDGSSWQPASTTPGTGGPLWLRDRAGNTSLISGTLSNSNGGPVLISRAVPVFFSSLQPAFNTAGSGDIFKLTATQYSEDVVMSANTDFTIKGGYDSSHGTVTGTTRINGSMTVQAGTLTMENLELGNLTASGGTVVAESLTML
jgi:photosystem II stability/assembly factor-like uncharacterized protein